MKILTIIQYLSPTSSAQLSSKSGKPSKAFEDCSKRTKDGISEISLNPKMCNNHPELLKRDCSQSTKIKKSRRLLTDKSSTLFPDQALAIMIDANILTNQCNIIREEANKVTSNLYPSYYPIKYAKNKSVSKTIIAAQEQVLKNVSENCTERNYKMGMAWFPTRALQTNVCEGQI